MTAPVRFDAVSEAGPQLAGVAELSASPEQHTISMFTPPLVAQRPLGSEAAASILVCHDDQTELR